MKMGPNFIAGLVLVLLGILVLALPVVIQWIIGILLIVIGILAVLGRQKIL